MKTKKLILVSLLALIPMQVRAQWTGKWDLSSSVQATAFRELHDGQYLAGISHPNLWSLNHGANRLFHIGIFEAWNSEHGNASFGPIAGADLLGISNEVGLNIPNLLNSIGTSVNLPSIFKASSYFVNMLTIDAFVGWRPVHTSDVIGNLTYGIGASLNVPFGIKELQNGL